MQPALGLKLFRGTMTQGSSFLATAGLTAGIPLGFSNGTPLALRNQSRIRMVLTLALILTFSPGEKEQRSHLSGFADNRPANPVAGFRVRRQVILPLPEGEGRGEGERS